MNFSLFGATRNLKIEDTVTKQGGHISETPDTDLRTRAFFCDVHISLFSQESKLVQINEVHFVLRSIVAPLDQDEMSFSLQHCSHVHHRVQQQAFSSKLVADGKWTCQGAERCGMMDLWRKQRREFTVKYSERERQFCIEQQSVCIVWWNGKRV